MTPLLSVDSLVSPHGGPFNLRIAVAECVAIVGRSGSGKSVFLRLVADLDAHTGEVFLEGRARSTWSGPQWRRQVVYQAAEPAWWAPTVRAHLRSPDAPKLGSMLARLELSASLLDADITRLSTGERQRMALVRSLDAEPRVLLLDEPTASLDIASTLTVEALLAERLRTGIAIVIVTHSREQAARMGHRLLELHDGELVAA